MELLNVSVGSTFNLKSPKGRFGIEIELEGQHLPDFLDSKVWLAKGDGSLRNGMEYVSTPTNYPRDIVVDLEQRLRGQGAIIAPTYRCSTHVHRNFIDLTWKDVIATIIIWNIIEPLVFKQMPPGRDGSIFCMSAYDTGDLPFRFNAFCDELRKKFLSLGFDQVCRQKYAALNLTRLRDLGTIEFRVFPPSLDGREVRKWCLWIDAIVDMAQKTSADNFSKFVHQAEKRPEDFVLQIFGELPVPADEVSAWIDLGCKTAYELVRIFNTSLKKKTRKKEEVAAYFIPFHFGGEEEEGDGF